MDDLPPPPIPSPAQAQAFEQRLLSLLSSELHRWRSGAAGEIRKLALSGTWPNTRLVLIYRDRAANTQSAEVAIWDPAWHDGPGDWESATGLAGLISSNWLDGSIS